MKKIIFPLLIIVLFTPTLMFGQSFGKTDDSISFNINPDFPRPGESATISITSYINNLDKSEIKWYVNNSLEKEGTGEKKFTFKMGALGENKLIKVVINKDTGGTVTKIFNLNPTEVDLIYEVNTYTPPFYNGKSWFTKQSTVKVVAIPRMLDKANKLIPPEEYTYTWRVDGSVVQNKSGFGKNIFVYNSPLISRDISISVEVSPKSSNNTAKSSIFLPYQDPLILGYEKNPIYGIIFERAILGNYYLNRDEITFEAIPYFFTTNNSFTNLDFEWRMNGEKFLSTNKINEATFRVEEDQKGQSSIFVKANNKDKMLQSREFDFTLFFDKETNNKEFNF